MELLEKIVEGLTKQRPPNFKVPDRDLPCRSDATPGTWFARDNVYNFIKFCRVIGELTLICLFVIQTLKMESVAEI